MFAARSFPAQIGAVEKQHGAAAGSEERWDTVLDFWFAESTRAKWWVRDPAFDEAVQRTLGPLHEKAAAGLLAHWQESAEGALSLVVLLDQVPRNIFRDTARAFATDEQARWVAVHAVDRGFDRATDVGRRLFFYMPFQHSEDLADQDRACALVGSLGDAELLRYAEAHRRIVQRFGRFPHRNRILERPSTPEEEAFLLQPGSSF